MYKKNSTSELSGVYSRYASLVQCSKINTHNTSYQQAKKKNHMTTYIHAEKVLDKIQHDLKKSNSRFQGNLLNAIKSMYDKSTHQLYT